MEDNKDIKNEEYKSYCDFCKIKEECHEYEKLIYKNNKQWKNRLNGTIITFFSSYALSLVLSNIMNLKDNNDILLTCGLTLLATASYAIPMEIKYRKTLKEIDKKELILDIKKDEIIDSYESNKPIQLGSICNRIKDRIMDTRDFESVTIKRD